MNHNDIKEAAYQANLDIVSAGLVLLTWGNASSCDQKSGLFAIKPSGVNYKDLSPEDMVLIDLETGIPVESHLNPSSDTDTHTEIYRSFPGVGGVVHTHSHYAVCHAQSLLDVPILGTTHADHFRSSVPVTRSLTEDEISGQYELNTGKVIAETFTGKNIDPHDVPGVLVASHGPFTWGSSAAKAVENAIVLEEISKMSLHCKLLGNADRAPDTLTEKHFLRKHGPDAYYGQEK